jgi:hypothetical protein
MSDEQEWMDSFDPDSVKEVLAGNATPRHLSGAFIFLATPEGADYWHEECLRSKLRDHIKNRLKRMLIEYEDYSRKDKL